jgi:Cu(I)/Ag(I) efflux system membrane fusion protein
MKTLPTILLTLAIAVPVTWFATRQRHEGGGSPTGSSQPTATSERRLLYYQSAMHPWIKSGKPGRCTICGMVLTPVYEGDSGFNAAGGDIVPLTQTMIQVMRVQTAEAQVRPLQKTLVFAGMVDDDAQRHHIISAYVEGRIEKLYINHHGADVTAGKPLAEIYSPTLLQAEREYRSLQGELRQNATLRLRQMGLTAEQIAELPQKLPDALTSELLSPLSGTVVNDEIFAGQYVSAGQKLFEIADFSTMWFVFRAYEQDIPWVKIGQSVDVTTPSVPGQIFKGKISFIDPNFDPTTRSTQVRVELPNPVVEDRRLLLHRVYGDGRVTLDAPAVLTVPRSAVIQTGPEAVVYVDQGGGAYARKVVRLGRRGDQHVEVIEGVKAGEKVVTNGNLLMDGQAEMNRSFAPSLSSAAFTDAQKKAIESFVESADAIAAALAKDDLAAFNRSGPTAMPATEALVAALKDRNELTESLKKLHDSQHLHNAADLVAARTMFHPFSTAAVALLEPLRKNIHPPALEVFECPMVDKVVPGAPKKGRWLQAAGTGIRNPYMGVAMSGCGAKIEL